VTASPRRFVGLVNCVQHAGCLVQYARGDVAFGSKVGLGMPSGGTTLAEARAKLGLKVQRTVRRDRWFIDLGAKPENGRRSK
jgi:hypothetical protein